MKTITFVFTIYCLCFVFSKEAAAEIIVIGSADLKIESISLMEIRKLYLASISKIEGEKIVLVDCSSIQHIFLKNVLQKQKRRYNSIWIKKIFQGNFVPPTIVKTCDEVIEFLKKNKNIIAYIYTHRDMSTDFLKSKGIKVLYREV